MLSKSVLWSSLAIWVAGAWGPSWAAGDPADEEFVAIIPGLKEAGPPPVTRSKPTKVAPKPPVSAGKDRYSKKFEIKRAKPSGETGQGHRSGSSGGSVSVTGTATFNVSNSPGSTVTQIISDGDVVMNDGEVTVQPDSSSEALAKSDVDRIEKALRSLVSANLVENFMRPIATGAVKGFFRVMRDEESILWDGGNKIEVTSRTSTSPTIIPLRAGSGK